MSSFISSVLPLTWVHPSPLHCYPVSSTCQGNSQSTKYWSQWIPGNLQVQQKQFCPYVSKLPPVLKLHSLAGSHTTLNLNKRAGLNLDTARFPATWICFLVMLKTNFSFTKILDPTVLLFVILGCESGFNPFLFSFLVNVTPVSNKNAFTSHPHTLLWDSFLNSHFIPSYSVLFVWVGFVLCLYIFYKCLL